MKILMVLTSHDKLGNTEHKTGFWVEEFAAPYYCFLDANADITLASPAGGQPPIDPNSELEQSQTEATERFNHDEDAQQQLANTFKLADVSAKDFDAIFYPGGHGPLWDLVDDADSIALIESFWQDGKPVSAVCHAPAVLLNAKDQNGEFIISGKAVTGFTNSEETAVGLAEVVPFLLQDELVKRGGQFESAQDWHPLAIQDGRLITGQNPASSEAVAEALLNALK
ncbi:dimethylallyltransferase [Photobacterium swingsii]|uniref:Type 1 glutamine amidotransferase domain-containing protein n=1 Tax=Photobacterium swingsii TaxID=680026 RepID=A0A0J8XWD1_9GAMM|nr:type 1 glutamine amidotransferase domain-containing protein [Photobacterium swingsii]KMV29669.1 dimethylallyltransferase [Photobacterium swingsii]PSW26536.1 type 1 glutamine amidotransferase domain-containing protein [Photobacterium swingsii]